MAVFSGTTKPQSYLSSFSLEFNDNSTVLCDVLCTRNDIKLFFLEPYTHWQGALLFSSAMLGVVASGFSVDANVRTTMQQLHTKKLDEIILPWQYYGNNYVPWGIAASCYIGGVCTSNNWLRETGRECLSALLCSGLFTTTLKIASGRGRPYTNDGIFDYAFFSFKKNIYHLHLDMRPKHSHYLRYFPVELTTHLSPFFCTQVHS
jgi:hypothetical protein